MNDGLMIRVWMFYDAPEEFQKQSPHAGDEDWIAHVPAYYPHYVGWLESGTRFGVCEVSEHLQPDGSTLFIGAHA